ncbi:4-hydroxy-tetrahydrodipicolinate synthase [Sporolactobacillus sp. THM19-2]|jgi:4-hydroxy-tetrahydrodipicolinate synthase|uniref:4-hydroxy-tetrahydrodipicolinate synthase n=1 Tax=Sporolactobacillus sp. THM19-2 TaxID=2511171 RepID=UPI00101EFF88|nr:4-hydroxy-tetrahydrodipicolinate synthase [Sporolactobacillus sp. THM19-2]RYL92259.1 4-hydroxy-tetrahydrodipicolinate synthase [Sporolactobacillus sp. THM19-2]
MDFGSLLTAMVTPFDEKGNVSLERTTNLVEHLLKTGSEGIVVAGTTGESPTLTTDEKLRLFEHVVKTVAGRAKVIVGTGGNNTRTSVALSKEAAKLGVDAIMAVAPFYNKPNQEGIYAHYKAIASSVDLPLVIYNIPSRSKVNITADTIIRLSKIDNIVAVKEASGNLDQMAAIISGTDEHFHLYSGDDGLTLPVLSIGGQGVISVASHVIGPEMKSMITDYQAGNNQRAAEAHRMMLPFMRELFAAPSPAPVKTLLNDLGIAVGPVRLPMVPLNSREHQLLTESYTALKNKQKVQDKVSK